VKQFFSIISAFIFLFGAAGYYLAFTVADNSVKNEMAEALESSANHFNIVHFTFSEKDLTSTVQFTDRSQKEFIYQGEHYDVVKSYRLGDAVFFTCVSDVKESSLFSFFTKHFDEQSSKNNSSQKPSVKTAMQDWFFQNNFSEYPVVTSPVILPNEVCVLSKSSFQIPSPPPKA
jgi:hypothetical protein